MTLVRFKSRPVDKSFNNLVHTFFTDLPYLFKDDFVTPGTKHFVPVNIKKTENSYQLEVVAPGFSKEDFKIKLEDNLLTISAEKKVEEEKKEDKHLRKEFQYSSFKRTFTVDETLDAENISAQYVNGILTLNFPKKEIVKEPVKQITIQ